MTLSVEQENNLSPIKRALLALEDMQAKLEALEYAKREPIAIIGMGCRFPGGADSPEAFWKLLSDGVDAIAPIPIDRWNVDDYYDPNPDTPGKMYARQGGFLPDIDRFDSQFFGISAQEARSLDPQQRLLLEVSWEALENANQASDRLFNSTTGVFIGICSNDYNRVLWGENDQTRIDAFSATGNALSVAAGRLSYILGLKGPSLTVDTACSSSLVAVHLACQHLRHKECNLALVGGVNLLLAPDSTIAFSKTRMLAADGRCKTFDAKANGYVRGEGCGVIVLKRLSDAVAEKDNILAVIRGSAVNHNGRSSSLIAPNGLSQQAVIRQALENGKVNPAQVSYVEVQGTGTALGEPIEVEALAAVFNQNRLPNQPLVIGSVKTNIGHLEAASGIASLIKVVLAMQHGEIPPHLHFQEPNPYINWDKLAVKVPTQRTAWTEGEQPRLAGISAFGFSGTNAHIILEEVPGRQGNNDNFSVVTRPLHILTLSAKTEESLVQLAQKYEKYLIANPNVSLADVCFTANFGRSHFSHRLSIVASAISELTEKLAAFSIGKSSVNCFTGVATINPKVAFLFGDENSISQNMGNELYETQPIFRESVDRCRKILHFYMENTLEKTLSPNTQTSLFILEYSLFQLWKSWGIEPAAVMGEGVGEFVAACVSGVFSLEDALKLIVQKEHSTSEKFALVAREIIYSPPQIPLVFKHPGKLAALPKLSEWQNQEISDGEILCLSSLVDWQQILQILAKLYVSGAAINWLNFAPNYPHRFVQLPTYSWQKKSYWVDSEPKEKIPPQPIIKESLTAQDIQVWLVQQVAQALGIKPEELDINSTFDSYGLDSMLAISIASAGQQFLGFEVSPLLLLHYPTIKQLAEHLAKEFAAAESEIFEI